MMIDKIKGQGLKGKWQKTEELAVMQNFKMKVGIIISNLSRIREIRGIMFQCLNQ